MTLTHIFSFQPSHSVKGHNAWPIILPCDWSAELLAIATPTSLLLVELNPESDYTIEKWLNSKIKREKPFQLALFSLLKYKTWEKGSVVCSLNYWIYNSGGCNFLMDRISYKQITLETLDCGSLALLETKHVL